MQHNLKIFFALSFALICGCSPKTTDSQVEQLTVTRVIDGDTIVISGGEKVRLIGIDTPEKGQCGFDEAKQALEDLLSNGRAILYTGTISDTDKYDRLLRYIEVEGTDVGLTLILDGLAIARYDSRDGYGPHDRESQYIAADENSAPALICD